VTNPGTTRRGVFGALAGAAAATAIPAGAAAAERAFQAVPGSSKRPNMLFILADDLGWGDLSSYGSPLIETPNLDRLARGGVRFTNGYSAGAVCSPTRVALYTGRLPGRTPGGLPEPIGAANDTDGIPAAHPTLPSLLQASGYATALIGKWHGGFLPHFSPLRSGFDEFFGNYSGGVDYYSKYSHTGQYDLYEGETPVENDGRYYTDVIGERAEAFVRRHHDEPWLLHLNFTSPHWPWEAPGDRAVSEEITAKIKAGNTQAIFHNDGGSLETYRKMVENLDQWIGRVLDALRRTGQERDTLVIFQSDNGGERFSYNWPFSGNKASLNEGGIRVPTIVRWPARIRSGQVSHEPSSPTTGPPRCWRSSASGRTRTTRSTARASPATCCAGRRRRSGTCSGVPGPVVPCAAGGTSTCASPRPAPMPSTTSRPTRGSRPTSPPGSRN
jgi:hypothetical protein